MIEQYFIYELSLKNLILISNYILWLMVNLNCIFKCMVEMFIEKCIHFLTICFELRGLTSQKTNAKKSVCLYAKHAFQDPTWRQSFSFYPIWTTSLQVNCSFSRVDYWTKNLLRNISHLIKSPQRIITRKNGLLTIEENFF